MVEYQSSKLPPVQVNHIHQQIKAIPKRIDKEVEVEIATGTKVRVMRSFIAEVLVKSEPAAK